MRHVVTTSRCHEAGHPELELAYDPERLLALDPQWFAGSLERMVHAGSRFEIGQSLQIGWSLVWFTQGSSPGLLGFEEPDMKSMPIVRQPGLTFSLGCLRLQKDTVQSVLYEAVVLRCAGALAYFAFPPGSMIAVDEKPTFFMNDELLQVHPGSFVDAQLKRSGV